jgi:hypothetical protein
MSQHSQWLADEADEYQPPESGSDESNNGDVIMQKGDLGVIQEDDSGMVEGDGDNGDLQGGQVESEAIQGKEVVSAPNEEVSKEVTGDINEDAPTSTPPPQGSSRVTGGVLRGRAVGNVLNLPDAPDILEDSIPKEGTLKLYSDLSQHPSTHGPVLTMKTKAHGSLKPILQKLVKCYSPVKSKSSYMPSLLF